MIVQTILKQMSDPLELLDLSLVIKSQKYPFSCIVGHPNFPFRWNTQEPVLMEYIFDNFDELIECGLGITKTDKLVYSRCFSILRSVDAPFYPLLEHRTNLIRYLSDFPPELPSKTTLVRSNYFVLLSDIYFKHQNPPEELTSPSFIRSIVAVADLSDCYWFLFSVMRSASPAAARIVKNCQMFSIISESMASANQKAQRCQLLFAKSIDSRNSSSALSILLSNDLLRRIIKEVLASPNKNSMNFLSIIAKFCSNPVVFHRVISKQILAVLRSFSSEFCQIVISSEKFTETSYYTLNLLLSIFNQKVDPQFEKMTIKMIDDFFKFPHNSTLHNCVLRLIQTLVKTKSMTQRIIDCTSIFGRTMEAFANRGQTIDCNYWGQLTAISIAISTYSKKALGSENRRWLKSVIEPGKGAIAIYSKPYGGSLPLSGKDAAKLDLVLFFVALLVLLVLVVLLIHVLLRRV